MLSQGQYVSQYFYSSSSLSAKGSSSGICMLEITLIHDCLAHTGPSFSQKFGRLGNYAATFNSQQWHLRTLMLFCLNFLNCFRQKGLLFTYVCTYVRKYIVDTQSTGYVQCIHVSSLCVGHCMYVCWLHTLSYLPGSPFSPGTPFIPASPGSPSVPLRPGRPGTPFLPGAPGSPLGPRAPSVPLKPGSPCEMWVGGRERGEGKEKEGEGM